MYAAKQDQWLPAVCALAEKCHVSIPRKLVNGIAADLAAVQMTVDLQLPIQIQLFVEESQKPVKTACAHTPPFTSVAPISVPQFVRARCFGF
jgi:hypothetical protein